MSRNIFYLNFSYQIYFVFILIFRRVNSFSIKFVIIIIRTCIHLKDMGRRLSHCYENYLDVCLLALCIAPLRLNLKLSRFKLTHANIKYIYIYIYMYMYITYVWGNKPWNQNKTTQKLSTTTTTIKPTNLLSKRPTPFHVQFIPSSVS